MTLSLESNEKQTEVGDKWLLKKIEPTKSKRKVKKKCKTPMKPPLKRKAESARSSEAEDERDDDDDIVKSSQSTTESCLKKKVQRTMLTRSTTPKLTSQQGQFASPGSVIDKLSISEQEINDIYENITDKESIEMTHDVDALITTDNVPSNVLEYSPTKDIKTEPVSEHSASESIQDPSNTEDNEESDPEFAEKNTKKETNKKKKKRKFNNKEKFEISEELLDKLNNLEVQMQHEVPPQHLISETSATRPMNKEQTLAFETYGLLKKGPYSSDEDKIIIKNWKDFCKIHDFDVKCVEPFVNVKYANNRFYYIPSSDERKHFVQFLANGLPWRSLYSVFTRFRNLYDTSSNSGKFSAEDDKLIMNYLAKVPADKMKNYIPALAKKLDRKNISVWQHYQKLKLKYNLKHTKLNKKSASRSKDETKAIEKVKLVRNKVVTNVKWTYPVVKKFLDALLDVLNSKHMYKLKNREINQETWTRLEHKTNIDCSVLKNFWYLQLHMQLFCPKPIYLNDFKINLIKYLHEKQPETAEDIEWTTVCADFDGMTPSFLLLIFNHLVKCAQERTNSYVIRENIEFLHSNHIPELMDRKSDAVLPILDQKLRSVYRISEQKVFNSILKSPLDHDNYCTSNS